MKEKMTRNTGLKILSLLLAVLLWIVILNVDDPVMTDTFEDIPVTKINESALISKDQVYDVASGNSVNVKVKGKRTLIEKLKKSDFQAIADLSQLSIVNAVNINVSVPRYDEEIEIIDQDISAMQVRLEKLVTEQFRIEVVQNGTVAEGYYVKETTARPNMIQVSAAESVINKIKEAVVEVNVFNAKESFTVPAVPKVYDKNGTLMDLNTMTLNYEEFDVSVVLLETKTVNLFIELKGTPYYGYEYVDFAYGPKQVVIAGEKENLDKVSYIKGEYNIDNKRTDIVDEVNIADFIKEDVLLIDENQNAVINIDIEKLQDKEISFNSSEIEIQNLPEGMNVNFEHDAIINAKVYGKKEILSTITKQQLKPYIDLKDAQYGTKIINIQFETLQSGITISNPSINVTLNNVTE